MYRNSNRFSIFIKRIFLFLLVVFICRSRTTALFFANDTAALRERQRRPSRTANRMSVYNRENALYYFLEKRTKKNEDNPRTAWVVPVKRVMHNILRPSRTAGQPIRQHLY